MVRPEDSRLTSWRPSPATWRGVLVAGQGQAAADGQDLVQRVQQLGLGGFLRGQEVHVVQAQQPHLAVLLAETLGRAAAQRRQEPVGELLGGHVPRPGPGPDALVVAVGHAAEQVGLAQPAPAVQHQQVARGAGRRRVAQRLGGHVGQPVARPDDEVLQQAGPIVLGGVHARGGVLRTRPHALHRLGDGLGRPGTGETLGRVDETYPAAPGKARQHRAEPAFQDRHQEAGSHQHTQPLVGALQLGLALEVPLVGQRPHGPDQGVVQILIAGLPDGRLPAIGQGVGRRCLGGRRGGSAEVHDAGAHTLAGGVAAGQACAHTDGRLVQTGDHAGNACGRDAVLDRSVLGRGVRAGSRVRLVSRGLGSLGPIGVRSAADQLEPAGVPKDPVLGARCGGGRIAGRCPVGAAGHRAAGSDGHGRTLLADPRPQETPATDRGRWRVLVSTSPFTMHRFGRTKPDAACVRDASRPAARDAFRTRRSRVPAGVRSAVVAVRLAHGPGRVGRRSPDAASIPSTRAQDIRTVRASLPRLCEDFPAALA